MRNLVNERKANFLKERKNDREKAKEQEHGNEREGEAPEKEKENGKEKGKEKIERNREQEKDKQEERTEKELPRDREDKIKNRSEDGVSGGGENVVLVLFPAMQQFHFFVPFSLISELCGHQRLN